MSQVPGLEVALALRASSGLDLGLKEDGAVSWGQDPAVDVT